jgi:hypothetical protein
MLLSYIWNILLNLKRLNDKGTSRIIQLKLLKHNFRWIQRPFFGLIFVQYESYIKLHLTDVGEYFSFCIREEMNKIFKSIQKKYIMMELLLSVWNWIPIYRVSEKELPSYKNTLRWWSFKWKSNNPLGLLIILLRFSFVCCQWDWLICLTLGV